MRLMADIQICFSFFYALICSLLSFPFIPGFCSRVFLVLRQLVRSNGPLQFLQFFSCIYVYYQKNESKYLDTYVLSYSRV